MTLKNDITRTGYQEMLCAASSIPREFQQRYWAVCGLYTYLLSQRPEINDRDERDRLVGEAKASFSIAKSYGPFDATKAWKDAWTPGATVAWEHASPRPDHLEPVK